MPIDTKAAIFWLITFVIKKLIFIGLSGGFLIGKLGRKPSMYIATAIFTAGYFLMLWTTNAWYLYFGRLITGLASGITSVSCPTYIAEIASPKVRGLLGSAFQVSLINLKFCKLHL